MGSLRMHEVEGPAFQTSPFRSGSAAPFKRDAAKPCLSCDGIHARWNDLRKRLLSEPQSRPVFLTSEAFTRCRMLPFHEIKNNEKRTPTLRRPASARMKT